MLPHLLKYPLQILFRRILGWTNTANFLEQFRYIIVASQLLNDHSKRASYRTQDLPKPLGGDLSIFQGQNKHFVPTFRGLFLTTLAAFVGVYTIQWLRAWVLSTTPLSGAIALLIFTIFALGIYAYVERRERHHVQDHTVRCASCLTACMQDFDDATSASMTLIQEVDLLSQGYNMQVNPHTSKN